MFIAVPRLMVGNCLDFRGSLTPIKMLLTKHYNKYNKLDTKQLALIKSAYFPALEGAIWPLEFTSSVIEYSKALDMLELFKEQYWEQIDLNLTRKQINVRLDPTRIGLPSYLRIDRHFKSVGTRTSIDLEYYADLNLIILKPLKFADDIAVYTVLGNLLGSRQFALECQVSKKTVIKIEHLVATVSKSKQQLEANLSAGIEAFELIIGAV